jgi:hypothetical protein
MAEEKPQSLDTQPANIPLLDPTINVQNLLAAAILRVNDLAAAEKERINERTAADMLRLDQLREAETRRVNESIASEGRRINEQMALREHYEEELRLAEAKRIDANRAGDAAAVATANERATQQAAVLASQMATMVENTRALVDANAAASSQQLQSAITAMNERLQNLEKMGWEGAGKEKYSDPALVNLVEQVRLLTSGAATNSGKGMGANALWGYIVGGIGLLALVIDLVSRLSVK